MPQLKMLFVIDWLGPASMSRVAAHLHRRGWSEPAFVSQAVADLHLSLSAATGLVDRLVEAGLAQRDDDPRDRRVVLVSCTSAGRDLVVQLRSTGSERLGSILDRLSQTDLERCLQAMEPVNRALEAEFSAVTSIPVSDVVVTLREAKL